MTPRHFASASGAGRSTVRSPATACVLAEPYLTDYQVDSLVRAVEETGIEIPMVVVNDHGDRPYDPDVAAKAVNGRLSLDTVRLFLDVVDRERFWTLVLVEKKLAEEFGLRQTGERRTPVEEVAVFSEADVRHVTPETDGDWNRLPDDVVADVAATSDLVVRYGFGLVEGDVLTAPEYGVVSFHPADVRKYRGLGPPQAYLDGRDVMGVTLQRLTEDIDAGGIVAYEECDVGDCATLWDVYDRLRDLQRGLLAEGIRNLRTPGFEPTVPASMGPYYSTTRRRELGFAGRILYRNLLGYLTRARERARTSERPTSRPDDAG